MQSVAETGTASAPQEPRATSDLGGVSRVIDMPLQVTDLATRFRSLELPNPALEGANKHETAGLESVVLRIGALVFCTPPIFSCSTTFLATDLDRTGDT